METTVRTKSKEIVLVLGKKLKNDQLTTRGKEVVDGAMELYRKRFVQSEVDNEPFLLLSGGKSKSFALLGPLIRQPKRSEAEAMYEYAQVKGWTIQNLIYEKQSTSMVQNMQYAKEILDMQFKGAQVTLEIVVDGWQIKRAKINAKKIFKWHKGYAVRVSQVKTTIPEKQVPFERMKERVMTFLASRGLAKSLEEDARIAMSPI